MKGYRRALWGVLFQLARASSALTSLKFMVVLLAVLVPCSVLFYEGKVEAATILVNTPNDTSTPGDGSCSLREAISNANSIGIDTTGGDCTVGTGTDIIDFDTTVQPWPSSIEVLSTLPAIAHNLTIDGGGHFLDGIIQNVGIGGTIQVNSGGTAFLASLRFAGVSNNGGMVTISKVFAGYPGTASYNSGTMAITNSTVANIDNHGTLTATNSRLGGTIDETTAFVGLFNSGTATVTNSTLSGVYNYGTLSVANSTDGSANPLNAAIFNLSGSATVSNSILANPAGWIVAFVDSGGAFVPNPECAGNPIINGGYNISDDGSCGFGTSTGTNGQTIGDSVDPLLEWTSEYNGGTTVTVALNPASPAIAAIPAARCPAADQRGESRPAAGQTACDIGAFELQPPAIITVNTVSDSSPSRDGFCSLREAIYNANSPGTDTTGGDCTTGTENNLIVFNVGGQITLTGPLPEFWHPLKIDGLGHSITIDGANQYQIFKTNNSAGYTTFSLANLTLSHGNGSEGGAIFSAAVLTVQRCTFSNNYSGFGGAIFNGGSATISDSTFTGNNSSGGGGAIGGGVGSVANSTFSSNHTDGYGSAISTNFGNPRDFTITSSTFSGNTAPLPDTGFGGAIEGATISSSILANNTGGNCPNLMNVVSAGHNISDDATCGFGASTGANDQPLGDGVDPKLDPNGLRNNGGPTQTVALQSNSPAINAIPIGNADCPGADQRGEPRPALGYFACDIGAYEDQAQNTQPGTNITVSPSATTDLTFSNVSSQGMTTATTSPTGPTQPTGFYFGSPATYVDVATTATFIGNITVCNSYDPGIYTDPAHLSLLHFDGGAWVDVTTSNDTVNHIICGQVTSLSPFTVAQKAVCNTTYSGTVKGNLTVASGSTCIIGGTVTGKVTQTGGRLLASAATIGGDVRILGGDFSIGSGTTIGGNLEVGNLSASKLQYQVCSTKINGNLQLQSNAAVIAVGGANCAGATVGGNIQVQNNTATTAVSRSTAKVNVLVMNNNGMTSLASDTSGGNIEVKNNANVAQIKSNSAGGNLDCTGNNASMVGGPNTASQLQGQCF